MGRTKQLLDEENAREMGALDICISAGAVQHCELHDYITFKGPKSKQAAYDLAKKDWFAGERHGFDDLPALMKAVDEAYNQNSEPRCARCADNAAS